MRTLLSRYWIGIHAAVFVGIAACAGLGWWQFSRAVEGNPRSLGYAFEWPTFAIIIVVLWIRGMRDAVRATHPGVLDSAAPAPRVFDEFDRSGPTREQVIAADEAEDPELAAYNAALAALNATDEGKQMDKRR